MIYCPAKRESGGLWACLRRSMSLFARKGKKNRVNGAAMMKLVCACSRQGACEEATELELELRAMRPLISIYLSPQPVKEPAKRQVRQKRRLVYLHLRQSLQRCRLVSCLFIVTWDAK